MRATHSAGVTGQLAHLGVSRVALGSAAEVTRAVAVVVRQLRGIAVLLVIAVLAVITVFAVIIALVPAIAAVAAGEAIAAAILGARRKARLLVANRLRAILFARRGTVFLGVLAAVAGSIAGLVARVAVVGIAGIPVLKRIENS